MIPGLEPRAMDPRICRASALVARHAGASPPPSGEPWPPPGALVELCGGFDGAVTSLAIAAVAASQRCGGITAWLQQRHGPLFPPDCAAGGIDLDALVVIHVPPPTEKNRPAKNDAHTKGWHDLPKAAELLLRSGAFDLVVIDLRQPTPRGAPRGPWPGRLQALAREHQSRVLLLTDAHAPLPFATGLSQRLCTRRRRVVRERETKEGTGHTTSDSFVVEHELVRDKLHAPPPVLLPHRGPTGLQ